MPGVNIVHHLPQPGYFSNTSGCVFKSESGDHIIYHHTEEGHHHHLVCSNCGKSMDCDEMLFWPVEKTLRDKYNFVWISNIRSSAAFVKIAVNNK